MGIYIPNIKKPKHCTECYFVSRDQCELQDNSYDYDTFKEQRKHCPLIEMDEEVFRQLKESAFIVKALYKKLKEKYKCVEEDVEEGIEEDFDPYQGDRDRDTFGEIY